MERLKPFFPVGCNLREEIFWAATGLAAAAFIAFAAFGVRFSEAAETAEALYKNKSPEMLLPEAVMPSFSELFTGGLAGFAAFLALLPLWGLYHYRLHFREGKSIYLMRRLPQKYELAKRCWAAPVAAAVITFITAILTVLICFIFYRLLMPEAALTRQ